VSFFDGLRHRLYVLMRGEAYADEVKREMRFHRELDTLAASGAAFGSETYYREEVRAMTLQLWIDRVLQDLSYAIRGLRRSIGFTAAVVIILALGVGVNAAMFSILDRVFLRMPAAVARPAEIRRLFVNVRIRNMNNVDQRYVAMGGPYPNFRAARDVADSSVGLSAYTPPDSVLIRDGNRRIAARQSLISESYFSTLGIHSQRGRFFAPSEYDIGVPTPLAVISDAFWERAYERSPSVLGRAVRIGATTYTIIGVAAPEFTGIDLDAADLWSPLNNYEAYGDPKAGPWYTTYASSVQMFARVPSRAAETKLISSAEAAIRPIRIEHWMYDSTLRVVSGPVVQALGPVKHDDALVVATRVEGVAIMVLLIVVANVLNLLLLRAQRRRREMAVRRALGVSRPRLIQQMTVESLCLAILGGGVAVVFSIWANSALRRVVFPEAHWSSTSLDARTIAFVFIVSVVIGVAGGMAPVFGLMRDDLASELKAGMKSSAYRASRARNALLALQAALCVVLLIGAGLFTRSLEAVRGIGTGYEGNTQFFASAIFDEGSHGPEVDQALPQIIERLRGINGVEGVGGVSVPPLWGFSFVDAYVQGRDSLYKLDGDRFPTTMSVTPGYFGAAGLRLIAGRDFSASDSKDAPRVVVVSATMARELWPNESPIGKCLFIGARDAPCSSVIGIAADARRMRLIERPGLQYYTAASQTKGFPIRTLVARARPGREAAIQRESEAIFRQYLPSMVGLRIRTFDSITERELRPWRLGSTLFTWLGALALIVAAIGVYAVIGYGVSQRTQEMGVRLALGARGRDIVDLVLADGLIVVGIGIAIGIGIALLLGRTVASLLFGVVPNDPSVIIGAAIVLCIVGSIASLVPGVRAAKIDPLSALRAE
jgi:predicted permease